MTTLRIRAKTETRFEFPANGTAGEESEYRHSFAFLQRAHYMQTGESIALLP